LTSLEKACIGKSSRLTLVLEADRHDLIFMAEMLRGLATQLHWNATRERQCHVLARYFMTHRMADGLIGNVLSGCLPPPCLDSCNPRFLAVLPSQVRLALHGLG
jgi:hypothetical protein